NVQPAGCHGAPSGTLKPEDRQGQERNGDGGRERSECDQQFADERRSGSQSHRWFADRHASDLGRVNQASCLIDFAHPREIRCDFGLGADGNGTGDISASPGTYRPNGVIPVRNYQKPTKVVKLTKRALVIELMLRPEGTTQAECLAITGWCAINLVRMAQEY